MAMCVVILKEKYAVFKKLTESPKITFMQIMQIMPLIFIVGIHNLIKL